MIWTILTIISGILLILYFSGGRNSVWGGLTLGIIVGVIAALIFVFRGNGFDWHIIGKAAIIGTLAGFIADLLGRLSDYLRRKT
ncbi:MAG: hypothetical protein COW72_02370 [Candidatus Nealsonbacteria bacterium CG18_big_fil_WC_8_21_14_2_50_37_10]|uniref:Uncharacterized protein n=1 Tax=Candidatus Nealsonbacteria bacterium CG18_big_fil_WC_8_21_14_2_50_37_10 TaxID=1974717 RepID=A0A2H0FJC2_9BACT|nr:MAG: hypothetical protein COW72_02370 [Candidatus Nealsonbacteria bacterium CG18_big_fil_WC_8_21_14_2_50_37_10]